MHIPFNKPYITGKEVHYIYDAVATGKISGNGKYTKMCQQYFEERWGFRKTLLTASCTDALEMCALLLNIEPGDEVIMPSFTFVSTALAFVRQGAKIVFADSRPNQPGIDEDKIEALITPKTKAIIPVHYAGVACNMDKIMDIANRHNLFVVEDAAQAIDSYYIPDNTDSWHPDNYRDTQLQTSNVEYRTPNVKRRTPNSELRTPLGSIGHLATFSFHETKNIQCGEGGLLAINDEQFLKRAEILWEKGTNRAEFFRGEVNKYGWVDTGSSFLPSEITAAFLWAQLEYLNDIQKKRYCLWHQYMESLVGWSQKHNVQLPVLPPYATKNAHMFYLVCPTPEFRTRMIAHLGKKKISAVFHYLSLHSSPYYHAKHDGRPLPQADRYSACLLRLPMFYELDCKKVIEAINTF
jgi:dTDP-4-amino-4,6-dideoxygalactose transaminase